MDNKPDSDVTYNERFSSLALKFETAFAQPPADLSGIFRASSQAACSDLRASSQAACSEALGPSLLYAAEANPLFIDASVKSIVAGLSTTEDITHTDEEAGYIKTPFNNLVRSDTGDCLRYSLLGSHQTIVTRKNTMFSYSLLAGSAVQNKLLGTALVSAFVDKGLQLPVAINGVKNSREVMAIGVCLVLLVAGGVLVDEWRVYDVGQLEKVVKALQLLKEKKEIKYPTGVVLLERTITAAEGGFAAETSAAEAWNLLFPDDAEDEDANGAGLLHSEVLEGGWRSRITNLYFQLAEFWGVNIFVTNYLF